MEERRILEAPAKAVIARPREIARDRISGLRVLGQCARFLGNIGGLNLVLKLVVSQIRDPNKDPQIR